MEPNVQSQAMEKSQRREVGALNESAGAEDAGGASEPITDPAFFLGAGKEAMQGPEQSDPA